ncbi:MAG: autotransporter domain-containing protein, partial [Deltaproteobacteria bacterium]|nr:autotransporter domain-containing protein [Deltaproteobacteria bacterium]
VDTKGFALSLGVGYGLDVSPGRLTVGAFVEYGDGDYDTYNSFDGIGNVEGSGDTTYFGGGLLARLEFSGSPTGAFYAEASARAGQVKNEFRSADLLDPLGGPTGYDARTPYYGAHLGLGYKLNVGAAGALDIHGKYLWNRVSADETTLTSGERVRFAAVDSHRVRAGVRYTHSINDHAAPFVGAAFEHEFDGKSTASSNGFDLPSPKMRGSTGVGELGLKITPSPGGPVSAEIGVQGYAGKRQGVTGSAVLKIEF